MSDTGSPTKLKSPNAMKPTTSMTSMPCRNRRRTKAITRLLDLHPLHLQGIVREVDHAHVRAHRPRDDLEVDLDMADVRAVDRRDLVSDGRPLLDVDLGLQLVDPLVDLGIGIPAPVVVAVGGLGHQRARKALQRVL